MYKRGKEIEVGDLIFIGISGRIGRVQEFLEHPQFAKNNPGYTARVAVTDLGSITLIDNQPIKIPENNF